MRVTLIVLAALGLLFALWLWLAGVSSTTATGWTSYAAASDAPAITRLEVSSAAPRRHQRVSVAFTSRRATGVFGHERRSYWLAARSVQPASACVNNRGRGYASRPAGYRVSATLDPARGDGGELGWCRGSFKGTVRYVVDYACPASGTCRAPDGFRRRSSVVARFSFVVR